MEQNYTQHFLRLLSLRGVEPELLLQESGLRPEQLNNRNSMARLAQTGLQLSADPGLGLQFGQSLNLGAHGAFGYALLSSGSLGDVLRLVQRYHQILLPFFKVSLLQIGEDRVALRAGNSALSPALERFFSESFFAAVFTTGAQLLPELALPEDDLLQFAYPEPTYSDLYREALGEALEFNAEHSQLILPARLMALELPSADPATEAVFVRQCEMLWREQRGAQPLSARVQQVLLHRRGELPSAPQVAQQINVGESTLRRRLRAEGTSFQQLLDQVRLHLALQYLENTRLPVADVGELLGFDDAANFRRAFKRWTGRTPGDCRRAD